VGCTAFRESFQVCSVNSLERLIVVTTKEFDRSPYTHHLQIEHHRNKNSSQAGVFLTQLHDYHQHKKRPSRSLWTIKPRSSPVDQLSNTTIFSWVELLAISNPQMRFRELRDMSESEARTEIPITSEGKLRNTLASTAQLPSMAAFFGSGDFVLRPDCPSVIDMCFGLSGDGKWLYRFGLA
jgi:hypothetical protein